MFLFFILVFELTSNGSTVAVNIDMTDRRCLVLSVKACDYVSVDISKGGATPFMMVQLKEWWSSIQSVSNSPLSLSVVGSLCAGLPLFISL